MRGGGEAEDEPYLFQNTVYIYLSIPPIINAECSSGPVPASITEANTDIGGGSYPI